MTLGQKNNNPLNVKNNPSNPWAGSRTTDERGHAVFDSIPWGIRAAVYTLAKKWANGKNTLRLILEDWAPASDTIGSMPGAPPNSPIEYTRFVSQFMEWPVDKPLRLFNSGKLPAVNDYDQMMQLLLGMSAYENSHWMPSVGDVLRGLGDYHDTVTKKG